MEKRQSILVAVAGLFILAVAGFWWFTQNAGDAPVETPVADQIPVMHSTVSEPLAASAPAPVIATEAAAIESDAVALSEEVVDKVIAEKNELASRASELEAQVSDGQALIALKEKQIRELEAQLQQIPVEKTAQAKKPAAATP